MDKYDKYASPFEKKGRWIGIAMTVLIHMGLLFISFRAGLKYIYPPPEELGILLEFEQEEPKPVQVTTGTEPRAENANPDNDVRLVQRSEAAVQGIQENRGVETTVGTEGDVEVPEPPRPKPINKKALFSSAKNKQDTLAQQVAEDVSDALRAGHSQGNTEVGGVEGAPSAKLAGRTVMGNLPIPDYGVEASGKVVVRIKVDQYGKVTDAIPGAQGTTVQDATLWEAAKKAALEARFNISQSAPIIQEGTITYVFTLR
ncbi:MAG: hypothetical protein J6U88_01180 [Bacteroidales bacterium]|nr:hypothetical protein [Bacteroidales bacterium]